MPALSLFNPGLSGAVTVPEIVAAFLAHIRVRVAAHDYAPDNYALDCYYLNKFAADHPHAWDDYAQRNLAAWIDANPQWKSGHTKKGIVRRVIACFKWAADAEMGDMIDRNPFRTIKAISQIPYKPRRPAAHTEYAALMRKASLQLKRGIFFIYRAGTRPIEMRQLLLPWVSLDAANPHLCLEWHKTFKKTGQPKIIGMDDVLARFLRIVIADRRLDPHLSRKPTNDCSCGNRYIPHAPADHVFFNCDGSVWTKRAFSLNLRRCAKRAGLDDGIEKKVSAGCFRSTFACDLIEAGFSNREVADMLGHASTEMVDQVYGAATRQRAAHLGDVAKRAAMRRRKG